MKRLYAFSFCLTSIALAACSTLGSSVSPKLAPNVGLPVNNAASFMLLYSFGPLPDGENPFAELLTAHKRGEFYGTTVGGGSVGVSGYSDGTVFQISSTGSERVIYAFRAGRDGSGPEAGLVEDSNGDLYGATSNGGGASACSLGCGVVFELKPSGSTFTEHVLHRFQGGSDGEGPLATLLLGKNGVLYGTTFAGGSGSCDVASGYTGCGTVFSLTPSGTKYKEKVVYNFTGGNDGESPRGSLIADQTGNLYGTTLNGGNTNSECLPDGGGKDTCGVVFRLSPAGVEKTLYKFKGGASDGANSRSALLAQAGGSFFGVTLHGGSASQTGPGTIFKLTKSGARYKETVIYTFCSLSSCSDGASPSGALGLRSDSNGSLYGTTVSGGNSSCSCGTVFKVSLPGSKYSLHTLHSFAGSDGEFPHDSVTLYNGYAYGTTFEGGASGSSCTYGCGTVFKVKQ